MLAAGTVRVQAEVLPRRRCLLTLHYNRIQPSTQGGDFEQGFVGSGA